MNDEHRLGFLHGFFGSTVRVETYLQLERERDEARVQNEQLRAALEIALSLVCSVPHSKWCSEPQHRAIREALGHGS